MAKASGLGWTTCSLDNSAGAAQAIINDVTDLQFATPRGVYDWTGIDKSAFERGLGLADFSGSLKGVWNAGGGATDSHTVLATVSSTSVDRTLTLTVGGKTLAGEVIVTDYQLSRATSGELSWTAPFQLSDGTTPTWA